MRNKTALMALLLSVLALVSSCFTAVQVSRNDDDALIAALMAQNQNLQEQIDALYNQTGNLPQAGTNAVLTAAGWPDSRGADITLTLTDDPGSEAWLRVMAGSQVMAEVPCHRDGDTWTATAEIEAGNGYTYFLIIGNEARTLASPEIPAYPELVNLADALNAYCNMVVGDWTIQGKELWLDTCYIHIQPPQLGSGSVICASAQVSLKHGDTLLSGVDVSPTPDEAASGYSCEITSGVFALPELAEGEQVDLWLDATLSNGQVLSVCAATWYATANGFSMAAG